MRVCRLHGGSSPQAKKAAAKRAAEAKAAAQLDRLGLRREGLTATELLAEVVERAGADLEYAGYGGCGVGGCLCVDFG